MTRFMAISAMIIALSCCERSNPTTPVSSHNEPEIVSVESDDAEMLAAMQAARDQFPKFWNAVSQDYQRAIPALGGSMVKAYFHDGESPNGGEHMWVSEVEYDGAAITGVLVDRPRHVQSVRTGERVSFPLERLSDWLYVVDDKAVGAFTVRLLRTRMTEEERREHDSHYPFGFEQDHESFQPQR